MPSKVRRKNKISYCKACNKEYSHYKWDKQLFCSKQCADNRFKIQSECTVCKTPILKSASLVKRNAKNYCSRQCYNLRNNGHKTLKRGTAHYQRLLENSSCDCGENRYYLLQIHHIDGNDKNNSSDNLEILCANCHIKRHLKVNKSGKWVYHPASLTERSIIKFL